MAKKKEFNWNTEVQYYKGIPVKLIPYHPDYYAEKGGKRFEIGKRKYCQSEWIPNQFLMPDGTIKAGVNIDFVFRRAKRQKKLHYAKIDIDPDDWN